MGKGNKKKLKRNNPTQGRKVKVGKAATQSANNPKADYPIFCLRYLQKGFDLEACAKDQQAAFAKQLHLLSLQSWNEIQLSGRHAQGSEKISREAIKPSIPSIVTEEVTLLAFRYAGKLPFVGFRNGATLHIIWIEPSFNTLYQHSH